VNLHISGEDKGFSVDFFFDFEDFFFFAFLGTGT